MKREKLLSLRPHVVAFKKRELNKYEASSFAVVFDRGDPKFVNGAACHASLSLYQNRLNDTPIAVIDQIQEQRCGEEVGRRFYEWLLNYSPFSSVFVTKSIKRAFSNGFVIADADKPANLLTGGLIAGRSTSESYGGIYRAARVWDELVIRGVHPNAAYVASYFIRPDTDDYDTVSSGYLGHAVFNSPDKVFFPFLNGQPIKKRLQGPYAIERSYTWVSALWEGKSSGVENLLAATIKQVADARKNVKGNNPFAGVDNVTKKAVFGDAMDEIALKLKEFIQRNNGGDALGKAA